MFPIKRIEQLHQELYCYYLHVISFQDKISQYQNIITKLSSTISELEDVIEDMRKYNNNNTNSQIFNLNK
jgi:CII-binding regulator of phage lambda lysogenization HflD